MKGTWWASASFTQRSCWVRGSSGWDWMVPQFLPSGPSSERALMSAQSQQSVAVLAQPASSAAPRQVPRMKRASVFIGGRRLPHEGTVLDRVTVYPQLAAKSTFDAKGCGYLMRSHCPNKEGTPVRCVPFC